MLCPTFCHKYDEMQPGKYLPGRILHILAQNVGHNT